MAAFSPPGGVRSLPGSLVVAQGAFKKGTGTRLCRSPAFCRNADGFFLGFADGRGSFLSSLAAKEPPFPLPLLAHEALQFRLDFRIINAGQRSGQEAHGVLNGRVSLFKFHVGLTELLA